VWLPAGKPADAFVVVEAVELAETGEDLLLEAVLEEAEEVLEVGQDGKQVRGEALQRHELESPHLDAFSLVEEDGYLFVRQAGLCHHCPAFAQHFPCQRLQEFAVVDAFVDREGGEGVLVWQVEELQLRQYVCETLLRCLFELHLLRLHFLTANHQLFPHSYLPTLNLLSGDAHFFPAGRLWGG
jgi:hypothetical protein